MPHRLSALILTLTLCLSTAALAREPMSTIGEAYQGPKTLSVELAPTAKGNRALIKLYGVNHPWNGRVLLAEVRKGTQQRVEYVIPRQGSDYVLMQDGPDQGPRIYLPGLGELRLSFDRSAALALQPEHLMTDYESQPQTAP